MKYFLILLCCVGMQFLIIAQNPTEICWSTKIDSIYKNYKLAQNDTIKLSELIKITAAYRGIRDFKKILFYNKQVKLLSDKLQQDKDKSIALVGRKGKAYYLYNAAWVLDEESKNRHALDYYSGALKLFETLKRYPMVTAVLSRMSRFYSETGNNAESLKYSFRVLKCLETQNDKTAIADEMNNIGATYDDMENYSQAIQYYIKAKNISLSENDNQSVALYNSNIGLSYKKLSDSADNAGNNKLYVEFCNEALKYYNEALKGAEESSDAYTIATCLQNIGNFYINRDSFKVALPYFLRSFALYKQIGMKDKESYSQMRIGEVYRGMGQNKKAEPFLIDALNTATKTKSVFYMMAVNRKVSEFYENTGQADKALKYYKNYISCKDSLYSEENKEAFTRAEMNYEFDKKEAAVKFSRDKIIYQLEGDNALHKQWRLFFIVLIVLAFVLLFFVKRAYDNKNKIAALLEAEDQRKNVLLQEVHHRINNNLQIISSLLTLQASHADNEKLSEYLTQSQNRIESLSVLNELLYHTNSPLEINIKHYIDKILVFHRNVSNTISSKIVIETQVDDVKFPTKLAAPLALIINELVTNAIKYAFTEKKEGLIKIALEKSSVNNDWQLTICDNGKGFSPETEKRKESLGLKLVTIMTKQIGGTLTVKNENETCFNIIFNPVMQTNA